MTRETLIILLKTVLTAVGSFLIGTQVLGEVVNLIAWETIVGIILSGVSVYWSIADKEYNIEKWQGFFRQLVLFVGGFFVARGKLTSEQLEAILGALLVLIPVFQSYASKKKATNVQTGKYEVSHLASLPKDTSTRPLHKA